MIPISLTIEYLSIENIHCDLNDLSHLFKHTHHLKKLYQNIEYNSNNEQLHIIFSSIISLNLTFEGSKYSIENLLQKLPNLISLTLQLSHWFVRCDWYSLNNILYTLPYTFDEFIYSNKYQSKSICFNNGDYWLYNHVNKIIFENNFYQYPARFLNIRHLDLHCSLNENILSALLRLDRLHSLDTVIRNDFSYSLFETFINQAPHLYSLRLKYFNDLPMEIFRIKTKSIQRIDLIGNSIYHIRYFNSIECEILSHSLLEKQCKILLINVEN
ncbi:unnamed protein product [Rotaria sordida]|uniref:Uncharacterized protein n=1 Tax=Rotaria sordida TaxID=392033 RepID=A0A814RNX5_9BILA|nr:unnamed protein product [Rotaria sordida]